LIRGNLSDDIGKVAVLSYLGELVQVLANDFLSHSAEILPILREKGKEAIHSENSDKANEKKGKDEESDEEEEEEDDNGIEEDTVGIVTELRTSLCDVYRSILIVSALFVSSCNTVYLMPSMSSTTT
jgi:hypothetical protein